MSTHVETVVDRQNSPRGLKLLRARSEIYRQATFLQKVQLFLTVIVPVAGAIIGFIWPDARGYVATLSLAITVLDAAVLDRAQRNQLKLAAKISEIFDTEVLQMPWSTHAVGAPPSPEQIVQAADAWSKGDDNLRDWYPTAVAVAPIHLARALCQRTNLWYDSEMRRRYSGILLTAALTLCGVLIVVGLALKVSLIDFSATVLAPTAPILVWTLRDFYRQRDTADAQALARSEVEQLWNLVISGNCGTDDCDRRSREIQNTIYARRVSSPLVFPGLYNRLRPGMEAQMNVGASELLRQAGIIAA